MKGFTWEARCERRQRRVWKRCKCIVDKITRSGKRHCVTENVFRVAICKNNLHKVFFSVLCSLLAVAHTQTMKYTHKYKLGHCRFAWSHWHWWGARITRSERRQGKSVHYSSRNNNSPLKIYEKLSDRSDTFAGWRRNWHTRYTRSSWRVGGEGTSQRTYSRNHQLIAYYIKYYDSHFILLGIQSPFIN